MPFRALCEVDRFGGPTSAASVLGAAFTNETVVTFRNLANPPRIGQIEFPIEGDSISPNFIICNFPVQLQGLRECLWKEDEWFPESQVFRR